jgi:hypothetical protein
MSHIPRSHVALVGAASALMFASGLYAQFVRDGSRARIGTTSDIVKSVREQKFGFILRTAVWVDAYMKPIHELTVCWESPLSANMADNRALVRQAVMETWQRYSDMTFSGWAECGTTGANIRIKLSDEMAHTEGLGNQIDDVPGGMVLNFTFKKWGQGCTENATMYKLCVRSIAVHEFGHALSFAHEQNRDDKDVSCNQPPQGSNGDEKLTNYDPDSVMNYCNPKYNNFGKLSYFDVVTVQTLYGLPKSSATSS